jgi:hypothetical protein
MFRRAVFLLGLLMLVGCADESVKRNPSNSVMSQPQAQALSDTPGQAYPTEIVSDFMQSCTQGEQIRQLGCGCSITNIQQTISLRDYVQVNQSVLEGHPLPVQMKQIFSTCNQQAIIAQQNAQGMTANAALEQQYAVDSYRSRMARSEENARSMNRLNEIGMENTGRIMTTRYGSDSSSESNNYPCDYPNQRDSMGRYCGDRAATVRPGGRY